MKTYKRNKSYENTDMPLTEGEFFSLQAYKRAYREYLEEEPRFQDDTDDYLKRGGFQFRKNPDASLEKM